MSKTSAAQHVPGVAPELAAARPDILQFGFKAGLHGRDRRPSINSKGEAERGKFDEMRYPLRSHFVAMGKGFTLVALDEPEPVRAPVDPEPLTEAEAALAAADLPCEYTRGEQSAIFSAKHHQSLVAKGWSLKGPADQARLRAVAEARG